MNPFDVAATLDALRFQLVRKKEMAQQRGVKPWKAFEDEVEALRVAANAARADGRRQQIKTSECGIEIEPGVFCKRPSGHPHECCAAPSTCLDCGRDYSEFPLDMLLPRAQWLEIHPDEHGVICAQCIVMRAARVPGATAVHAVIEIAPQRSGRKSHELRTP